MPRVFYLVCPSVEAGVEDALGRGWRQVARARFVTDANEDVRLVTRFQEMIPFPGVTPMVKGRGYDSGEGTLFLERWIEDAGRFDAFAASGQGEWL